MKRKQVIRYLKDHGCHLVREGGNHSWWHNPSIGAYSALPRHTEIADRLVYKICKDLGIPKINKYGA